MTQVTKRALEEALKRMLLEQPLSKITIQDLADECGISRMTFYYHFKDIYDLVEWSFVEDANAIFQAAPSTESWEMALQHVFEMIKKDELFIMSVYHAVSREQIERYLHLVIHHLMSQLIEKSVATAGISLKDKEGLFVTNFYKYALIGTLLDWVKSDMKADYQELVVQLTSLIHDPLIGTLRGFASKNLSKPLK